MSSTRREATAATGSAARFPFFLRHYSVVAGVSTSQSGGHRRRASLTSQSALFRTEPMVRTIYTRPGRPATALLFHHRNPYETFHKLADKIEKN